MKKGRFRKGKKAYIRWQGTPHRHKLAIRYYDKIARYNETQWVESDPDFVQGLDKETSGNRLWHMEQNERYDKFLVIPGAITC